MAPAKPPARTALVVEPNESRASELKAALASLGVEAVTASDAEEGWRRFAQIRPEAVFAGFAPGARGGQWLVRRLRDEFMGRMPAVYLACAEDEIRPSLSLEPDAILIPPIPRAALAALLGDEAWPSDSASRQVARLRELFELSLLGGDLGPSLDALVARTALAFGVSDCVLWAAPSLADWPRAAREPASELEGRALLARCQLAARAGCMLIVADPQPGGAGLVTEGTGRSLFAAPFGPLGHADVGALCLVDDAFHWFGPEEQDLLRMLARRVASELVWVSAHRRLLHEQEKVRLPARIDAAGGGLPPGSTLGGMYRILHELSRGAMGVVYRGEDLGLGRPVAIKVLRSDLASDQDLVVRFRSEASLLASLHHNNLVQVHSFGQEGDAVFFVMELVEGEALSDVIVRIRGEDAHIGFDAAAQVVEEIADALEAIHSLGIIHRDVKPANVLLDRVHDRAVLVDVGVAKRREEVQEAAGTPGFAAPESFMHAEEGPSTDVYGLAATAYAMLTGLAPFGTGELDEVIDRQLYDGPTAPSHIRPELPKAADEVLFRALAPERGQRYKSATAFSIALARALGQRQSPAETEGFEERERQAPRRRHLTRDLGSGDPRG